jgi:hypothetical protein
VSRCSKHGASLQQALQYTVVEGSNPYILLRINSVYTFVSAHWTLVRRKALHKDRRTCEKSIGRCGTIKFSEMLLCYYVI